MNDYRSSLLDLAGAVRSGMDPNTAYSIYGNMQAQQAQQLAARQARIQSLVDMVMQGAQGGLPFDQAQMLASVQSGGGGIPNPVQSALDQLYPTADPMTNANGQVPDFYSRNPAGVGSQATSPLYPGPSPEQQMQEMQLQQAQFSAIQQQADMMLDARWSEFTTKAAKYAAAGTPVAQFVNDAMNYYSDLAAADPQKFQALVNTAFAQQIAQQQANGQL